ncbi:MAG: Flp pilus assembly protein TadD [Pseudohongiellaceae bacterium]|jgi:Flp pilus assembly protein TadD
MKTLYILLICLLTPVSLSADQNDPRLEDLFADLKSENDVYRASSIADQIWQIWFIHEDPQVSGLMERGMQQMNSNSVRAALDTFDRLITLKPDFAEAWNRRATIYYQIGEFDASLRDIDEVLKLEPFHFGALSGRGLVYMGKENYFMARGAFLTLLEVYPAMPGVKNNIEMLEQVLRNSAI